VPAGSVRREEQPMRIISWCKGYVAGYYNNNLNLIEATRTSRVEVICLNPRVTTKSVSMLLGKD